MTRSPSPAALLCEATGALDRAGVVWCLLRGEADLAATEGDVDVLVAAGDVGVVGAVLEPAGFVPVPAWGRRPHRFFVAPSATDGTWLKLDVVAELAFGPLHELPCRDAAACLARRRRVGPVAALAADDAFWALLLHCLLDRGAVPSRHARRLSVLAPEATADGPLARSVAATCPPGWDPGRMLAAARRNEWSGLAELAPGLRRGWTARHPVTTRARRGRNALGRRLGKVHTFLRRRGMAVALLGPDGAGKSTLAAGLCHSFYLPTRSLYAGLYGAGAGKVPGLPGLRLAVRLVRLWRLALTAEWHKSRGRLVVFDRYTTDALLPGRGGVASRARRWILAHACPAPELLVVLDAPAEDLFGRKGEHDVAKLEEQRAAYRSLARLPHAVVVDAARPAEEVRREVTDLIWRRWGRRRPILDRNRHRARATSDRQPVLVDAP
jgi:thymidylate kinase